MKILFLSAWLPFPPINGAKLRIYNLIRELAKKHDITLLALSQTIPIEETPRSISTLETYCRSVKVVPARIFRPVGFSIYKGLFSITPRSIVQTYNDEMAQLVENALEQEIYDVVVASEVSAPSFVSLLASKIKSVPKILDAIEIELAIDAFKCQTHLQAKIRCGLTLFKLRTFTRYMMCKTNACTVPSEMEKRNLEVLSPTGYSIEVLPHSLDLEQYNSCWGMPEPNSLVFTGSFTYYPNLDAIKYFALEIFPLIRDQEPAATLKVIGNLNKVETSKFPGYASMIFTGLLQDVKSDVARSWLSIVPLRLGSGTRLKIIESMALGTPVISTSKGAEGLEVTHGENILIADTPQDFSSAVLEVLHCTLLREKLSIGGRVLVASLYNVDVMGNRFNTLLERIVQSRNK